MLPSFTWIGWQLSLALFWLAVSISLCLTELFLPKSFAKSFRFVPLTTGICAFLLALFLFRANTVPPFRFQIFYWMGVSTACVIWIRPMFMKQRNKVIKDATEARTITEITPVQTGEVLYEGSVWQASCDEHIEAIPPNQKVYVLRREGNTLIVAPKKLFQ
ncbi:NfeD family protein [Aerosakkonema sp. BLCC-F183]|uniref:NfeD family protein n=1 Tax=Aerosakkonema sp. BLCC-F183 TaxID=3342834 RepID=UPI0035BC3184